MIHYFSCFTKFCQNSKSKHLLKNYDLRFLNLLTSVRISYEEYFIKLSSLND